MKITVLGSGTGIIRPDRRSPAALVQSGGETLAFECGWGVPEAFNQLNLNINDLNHLCISHSHADHMAALPAVLQSRLISTMPHLSGREAPNGALRLHGYNGLTAEMAALCQMMVPELDPTKSNNVVEIVEYARATQKDLGQFTLKVAPVHHMQHQFAWMNSVAFRVEAEGKSVVWSGDLGWDEKFLELLQGADVAMLDATVPLAETAEHGPRRHHLSPAECGKMAAQAGVRHLVLMSLYGVDEPEAIESQVRQHYSGKLTIPHDLQVIEL